MSVVGLSTHIWNNNLKSIALLCCFPLLLIACVWGFGALIAKGYVPDYSPSEYGFLLVSKYWGIVLGFTAVWFIIAWFFNTSLVNIGVNSHSLTRQDNPKLYNMLENMCISRGIQMPHLRVIDSSGLNAFASGITEKTYTITFTQGLLRRLEDDEIQAVMAHELTHIINRDVRLLIISVIFVGLFGYLSQTAFRMVVYGRRGFNAQQGKGKSQLMLVAFIILIIGYVLSSLVRFAISRSREYMADAGAVEITKNPEAMIRALMKISGNDYVEETPADIEQMCIENSHKFMSLFATHPPIQNRIQALSETTNTPIPVVDDASDYAINKGKNPWV